MKRALDLRLCVLALAVLLGLGAPARAQPDAYAEFRAKADRLCHELKAKAQALEARVQQLPDRAAQQQATKDLKTLQTLVQNTQEAIAKGPGELSPREFNERLLSATRAAQWESQRIERQSFGAPSSIAARVALPSIDDFKEKVSRGFDGARVNVTPRADHTPPAGGATEFFRVQGAFKPTDTQTAVAIDKRDGHLGGGVMLEGTATGLGAIDAGSVAYDGSLRAITFNGVAYFLKIAPWNARALSRQIADDKKGLVGVSMTAPRYLVFGDNGNAIYRDSEVAHDLLLVDGFLADIVFNQSNWNLGYKYTGVFTPRSSAATDNRLVRWAFTDFSFKIADGRALLAGANVEVRIIPIASETGPEGQFHPDVSALEKGYTPPPEELANARHITENLAYYRQELIIDRVLAHGETAALFRALKSAGADLNRLARAME